MSSTFPINNAKQVATVVKPFKNKFHVATQVREKIRKIAVGWSWQGENNCCNKLDDECVPSIGGHEAAAQLWHDEYTSKKRWLRNLQSIWGNENCKLLQNLSVSLFLGASAMLDALFKPFPRGIDLLPVETCLSPVNYSTSRKKSIKSGMWTPSDTRSKAGRAPLTTDGCNMSAHEGENYERFQRPHGDRLQRSTAMLRHCVCCMNKKVVSIESCAHKLQCYVRTVYINLYPAGLCYNGVQRKPFIVQFSWYQC